MSWRDRAPAPARRCSLPSTARRGSGSRAVSGVLRSVNPFMPGRGQARAAACLALILLLVLVVSLCLLFAGIVSPAPRFAITVLAAIASRADRRDPRVALASVCGNTACRGRLVVGTGRRPARCGARSPGVLADDLAADTGRVARGAPAGRRCRPPLRRSPRGESRTTGISRADDRRDRPRLAQRRHCRDAARTRTATISSRPDPDANAAPRCSTSLVSVVTWRSTSWPAR